MADDAPFLPGLSPVVGKAVQVTFDAGRLTSDGGVLVLAEIERHLGIAERLAGCIEDPRAPDRVQHGLAEMIRYRALLIAAGYVDANIPTRSRAREVRQQLVQTGRNQTSNEKIPDNTIDHDLLAELRVAYGGRGQITDVQQPRIGAQVPDIILPHRPWRPTAPARASRLRRRPPHAWASLRRCPLPDHSSRRWRSCPRQRSSQPGTRVIVIGLANR